MAGGASRIARAGRQIATVEVPVSEPKSLARVARRRAISATVAILLSCVVACSSSNPSTPSAPGNYAGVWTGVFEVTDCRDLDVPGLTQFHLCGMQNSQSYQFTLTQTGTIVSGTYTMKTAFYSCQCGGMYGELTMSGKFWTDR